MADVDPAAEPSSATPSDGPFRELHPNGDVAREGRIFGGKPRGIVVSYASDAPDAIPLRSCCVPPGAHSLRSEYDDDGQLVGETFFDRSGRRLLSDGSILPDRPAGLPAAAMFDQSEQCWTQQSFDDDGRRTGPWLWWSVDGTSLREAAFDSGRRHGRWTDRAILPGRYRDAQVRQEEGRFIDDLAVGPWVLRDADGSILSTTDLGESPDAATLASSPALADNEGQTPEAWRALAHRLVAQRRLGEGLCAMARGAAAEGRPNALREFIATATSPVSEPEARRLADEAVAGNEAADIGRLLNALARGGEAADVLRAIASALIGADRAARDLANAALLLAPERPEIRQTRALIRVALGDVDGARADAEMVGQQSPAAAAALLAYIRVLFSPYAFPPARDPPDHSAADGVPDAPAQPAAAMVTAAQKYATRLMTVRAAVTARTGAAPHWGPPDLSALLPDGPVALGIWRFTAHDEDGDEEIAVDERIDTAGQPLAALMRVARADWNALAWLCWSAGLDRVGLPDAVRPPPSFAGAMIRTMQRYWRCRDQLETHGLRSLTQGIPGFVWEDMPIETAPAPLAEIAAYEHAELAALFFWLCDGKCQSPWQSDLRQT